MSNVKYISSFTNLGYYEILYEFFTTLLFIVRVCSYFNMLVNTPSYCLKLIWIALKYGKNCSIFVIQDDSSTSIPEPNVDNVDAAADDEDDDDETQPPSDLVCNM